MPKQASPSLDKLAGIGGTDEEKTADTRTDASLEDDALGAGVGGDDGVNFGKPGGEAVIAFHEPIIHFT